MKFLDDKVNLYMPDLTMLEKVGLTLGRRLTVMALHDFDKSMEVELDNGETKSISISLSSNIFVKPI